MKKIPFDIAYRHEIESGEYKVETRDGNPARIICWDKKVTGSDEGKNILALIDIRGDGTETPTTFYQDGHLWDKSKDGGDSHFDLFIITPESEPTEFEPGLQFLPKEMSDTDWSEFRRETAKDILSAILSNPEGIEADGKPITSFEDLIDAAINTADLLIEKLRKEK